MTASHDPLPETELAEPLAASDEAAALCIGSWRFEPRLHRLQRGDRTVRVEPQVARLLLHFAENPGRPLSKEEIVGTVWDGRFISDSALTRTMAELRKALGDDARDPRFIETIPKSGYRLVAEVSAAESGSPIPPAPPRPGSKRHRYLLPLLLLAATLHWATTNQASESSPSSPEAPERASVLPTDLVVDASFADTSPASSPAQKMIAVLPLEDLSRDAAQDFFAEGMTEALIAELAQSSSLGVISRHSVTQLVDDERPLLEVARKIGVDALVEGSVMRSGDRVRVTVQLTDLDREAYSWARSYDRELRDVLALQSEITRAITTEIRDTLDVPSGPAKPVREVDPEVYDLYLLGRQQVRRAAKEGVNQAAEYLEGALELDPTYAPAYAGLVEYYTQLAVYGHLPPEEAVPELRAAAAKGLMLDPELPEIYASLGIIEQTFDRDLRAAESGFLRALEINPSHAEARRWYAYFLTSAGRFDEAIEQARRAAFLDPMSAESYTTLAHVYLHAGDYRGVEEAIARSDEIEKSCWDHPYLLWSRALDGRYEEVLPELRKAIERGGDRPQKIAALAWTLAQAGEREEAEGWARKLAAGPPEGPPDHFATAIAFAGLGEVDAALEELRRAAASGSRHLSYVKVEPFLASLRSEPGFVELTASLGQ